MNQDNIQINMQMPMDINAWMVHGGGHGWATPSPGMRSKLRAGNQSGLDPL